MDDQLDRDIRERAYRLWEEGGRQEGTAEQNWLAAEASLAALKSGSLPGVGVASSGSAAISPVPAIVSPPDPTDLPAAQAKKPDGPQTKGIKHAPVGKDGKPPARPAAKPKGR